MHAAREFQIFSNSPVAIKLHELQKTDDSLPPETIVTVTLQYDPP